MFNVKLSGLRVTFTALKTVSITYSESVPVALIIQHAKRMRHVIYCHLWHVRLYYIFPHNLKKATIPGKNLLT